MNHRRILVAGIGNIFLGDDGFGVEVIRRLAGRSFPAGVRVADFGIRGYDLALALADGCGLAILVDAASRGGAPGTVYTIAIDAGDPAGPGGAAALPDGHGIDPAASLRLAAAFGRELPEIRLIGCEPAYLGAEDGTDAGLSPPVQAAIPEALRRIEALIRGYLQWGCLDGGDPDGGANPGAPAQEPSATERTEGEAATTHA